MPSDTFILAWAIVSCPHNNVRFCQGRLFDSTRCVHAPADMSSNYSHVEVQAELDKHKFFAKPKLALDCVGGPSSVRLSDALAQVGLWLHNINAP